MAGPNANSPAAHLETTRGSGNPTPRASRGVKVNSRDSLNPQQSNGSTRPSLYRNASDSSLEETYNDSTSDTKIEVDLTHGLPLLTRRSSIPVRLEKTKKQGRYALYADDPEVRDIIRRGLERQEGALSSDGSRRNGMRELVFTRRFTAFDRQNPSNTESPFHGFFTLFWLAMALLLVRVAVQNSRVHGSVLGNNEILRMMFRREVLTLGLTDGVMCGTTAIGLVLQRLILNDYLEWNSSGWIIQNVWQAVYLGALVGWTFYREWPWTHTIFIVLHGLVFVMKQHSYAFSNGHLSQVYKQKLTLERKLDELNASKNIVAATPIVSSIADPSTLSKHRPYHRCGSPLPEYNSELNADSTVAAVAATVSSGKPLGADQMKTVSDIITSELKELDAELKGKCVVTENYYPRNLTLFNWAEWTCLPTLVYELEYPRQNKINWWYVAEKTLAVFGVLTIMQVISQAYIYPAISEAVRMKDAGMTLEQRWQEFPYLVLDMLLPLLLEQLLTFYIIWEGILNVLAELTGFADRGFYGPWWNSISWDQYARDWNRPVHNFLLRHVYHSSISSFKFSKSSATFVTFLLSACVHELLMFCLFKKVRGYLFTMQLLQMPLVALSRTRLLRGKTILGNVLIWTGLFVFPGVLTGLYLVV